MPNSHRDAPACPVDTSSPTREAAAVSRRRFLGGSALALGSLAAGSLDALVARAANAQRLDQSPDYGPLVETADRTTGLPLLRLPEGFTYSSFGWTGDLMDDGAPTPGSHDGMAVVARRSGRVWLVRNHELGGTGTPFAAPNITYDPLGRGGTTTLQFHQPSGRWEASWGSIGGTVTNCAGGPTPWGSWLTCEETLVDEANGFQKPHGWVYEVPAHGLAVPQPLKGLGRFVHEAVAVQPGTGIVYETEDRGTAGFYRFIPLTKGALHQGGVLQMLRVVGSWQADLTGSFPLGTVFDVDWVTIDFPERAHNPGTTDALGVHTQGHDEGGATFIRGEGAWFADGRVFFISTSGGAAGEGQVWEYSPGREQLRLIFESPSEQVLDNPDNITVSPRGGIILCEDGDLDGQRLQGLTRQGEIFPFAQNNVVLNGEKNGIVGDFRGREFAGATFGPNGKYLFVNIQTPGITFAITGPWRTGAL